MRTIPAAIIFAGACALVACPNPVIPTPPAPVDTDYCQAMCDHLGPQGLNCPEGQAVYDSDKPGEAGVPNESCTEFCTNEQNNGVYMNPRCLAQVPTCDMIEAWRLRTCQ